MRVNLEEKSADDRARPKVPFAEWLKCHPGAVKKPGPQPTTLQTMGPLTSSARLVSLTERLRSVRAGHHAESTRLQGTRSESVASQEERVTARMLELVAGELRREDAAVQRMSQREGAERPAQGPAPESSAGMRPLGGTEGAGSVEKVGSRPSSPTATVTEPSSHADLLLSLIERIDVLVRENRPALSFTVGGELDAEVEIERRGPAEVAVKIRGRTGRPSLIELTELEERLAERGLRLCCLSLE